MIKFNVKLLKISVLILTCIFLLFSANVLAQESRFYKLNLVSVQGKLKLQDITVLPGSISTVPVKGDYKYELLSLEGLSLYVNNFDVPPSTRSVSLFDPDTGEVTFETVNEENVVIVLVIPYFPNGKEIDVYGSKNDKILTIPVFQFAQTCGNKICDIQENSTRCPQDCTSDQEKLQQCEIKNDVCDPACFINTDPDCKNQSSQKNSYLTFFISIKEFFSFHFNNLINALF